MPWLFEHLPHNTAYKPFSYVCILNYIYVYMYVSIYLSIYLYRRRLIQQHHAEAKACVCVRVCV
jgi:hypothetical protein